MLGMRRPFVLEIKNPKIRETDLEVLESKINSNNPEKSESKLSQVVS